MCAFKTVLFLCTLYKTSTSSCLLTATLLTHFAQHLVVLTAEPTCLSARHRESKPETGNRIRETSDYDELYGADTSRTQNYCTSNAPSTTRGQARSLRSSCSLRFTLIAVTHPQFGPEHLPELQQRLSAHAANCEQMTMRAMRAFTISCFSFSWNKQPVRLE